MDKIRLYKKAYKMLENLTPLKMDCGSLCDKACCKGDDEMGMHLFPGEAEAYTEIPSFLSVRPTNMFYSSSELLQLAVCDGSCRRNFRPLSCRIFPLVPYIDSNNMLSIIIDPRAVRLCPIAQLADMKKLNRFFVRNVRNAFRLLMQDKEIEEYVKWLSRYIDDYNNVKNMF